MRPCVFWDTRVIIQELKEASFHVCCWQILSLLCVMTLCGHYSWKGRAGVKAYKMNKSIQNYMKGKCLPGSRKSLTVSVTVCFPHFRILSSLLGSSCNSMFLVHCKACRLCWTSDNLSIFRNWQESDKKILLVGVELQLISKTKTACSQNPLKWFCSFSSCKSWGFFKFSLVFAKENITGLSLFLYASLFFFPLMLCSELFTHR